RAEVAMEIATDVSTHSVLQQVSEALIKRLEFSLVRIWSRDENSDTLVIRACAGLSRDIDEFKSNVSMGSSFVGRVAERKKPFISDNAPGDADRVDSEWIRRENIKSIAAYPLM